MALTSQQQKAVNGLLYSGVTDPTYITTIFEEYVTSLTSTKVDELVDTLELANGPASSSFDISKFRELEVPQG